MRGSSRDRRNGKGKARGVAEDAAESEIVDTEAGGTGGSIRGRGAGIVEDGEPASSTKAAGAAGVLGYGGERDGDSW